MTYDKARVHSTNFVTFYDRAEEQRNVVNISKNRSLLVSIDETIDFIVLQLLGSICAPLWRYAEPKSNEFSIHENTQFSPS